MIKQADRRVSNIVVRIVENTKIPEKKLYEHILECIADSNERCEDPSTLESTSVKEKKGSLKYGNA